jgi:hypothetical protein
MHENGIGSIVIVKKNDHDDNYRPMGIITERDIVRVIGSLDQSLLKLPLRASQCSQLLQRTLLKMHYILCKRKIFVDLS